MTDFNRISRFSSGRLTPTPIHLLDRYLSYSFSESLNSAKASDTFRQVRMSARRAGLDDRLPLAEEDTRVHAWLSKRLAALRHERHGFGPQANRLLRAIACFMLWPFVRKERFNTD